MAKNKKQTNNGQFFNKKADIITDNGKYHIRKNRIYICGSDYYGKVYIISSNKYSKDNVHIIKQFYPSDNNRIRFLMLNLKNAKKFKTIEKLPDGTERRINVIEKYTDSTEYICSIGDIKSINSDLNEQTKENKIKNIKILKLILTKDNKDKKGKKKAS